VSFMICHEELALREAHHMQWSACIYELWTRR
jgi:hypothetical protein